MKPQKPRSRATADISQHDKDPSLLKGHNSQINARVEAFNSQAMVLNKGMNKIVSSGTINYTPTINQCNPKTEELLLWMERLKEIMDRDIMVSMKKKKLKYTAGRGIFRSYIIILISIHGNMGIYLSWNILVYPIGNNDLDILSHI